MNRPSTSEILYVSFQQIKIFDAYLNLFNVTKSDLFEMKTIYVGEVKERRNSSFAIMS